MIRKKKKQQATTKVSTTTNWWSFLQFPKISTSSYWSIRSCHTRLNWLYTNNYYSL